MSAQILGALGLACFAAAYFVLPYYFLKRGWIFRAGLLMLSVAFVGMALIVGEGPGGGALIFLSLPLPLILVLVGILMAIADKIRGSRARP